MKFTETTTDGELVSAEVEIDWEEYEQALIRIVGYSDHAKGKKLAGMKVTHVGLKGDDRMNPDTVVLWFSKRKE
jgi:hypothetical protein